MKAPQVNAFYVNEMGGNVMVEFEFDHEKNRVVELKPFSSKSAADAYLASVKRSWLMQVMENWLDHKRHIINAYPNPDKQAIFDEVYQRFCEMERDRWGLQRISQRLIDGKKKLEALLPATTNTSHESSQRKLIEILLFCQKELEVKPATTTTV